MSSIRSTVSTNNASQNARGLAVALIAAYEGVALLANTLRDPKLITNEARRLKRWADSIS